MVSLATSLRLRSPQSFEVVSVLGRGGMATVYRALDRSYDLPREVALKVLRPHQRLGRYGEAELAERIEHPNVVKVLSSGECEVLENGVWRGSTFLAMELVPGLTLADLLEGRTLSLARALEICLGVARALTAVHAAQVVHRDVKPENVFVADGGAAKLGDFGVAVGPGVAPTELDGTTLGTVRYMAPERLSGRTATPLSDVYSLGVILYEVVCGQHPHGALPREALVRAIVHAEPLAPCLLRPELPAELDALILRMLAKDASRRPAAAEVATQLGLLLERVSAQRLGRTRTPAQLHRAQTATAPAQVPPQF